MKLLVFIGKNGIFIWFLVKFRKSHTYSRWEISKQSSVPMSSFQWLTGKWHNSKKLMQGQSCLWNHETIKKVFLNKVPFYILLSKTIFHELNSGHEILFIKICVKIKTRKLLQKTKTSYKKVYLMLHFQEIKSPEVYKRSCKSQHCFCPRKKTSFCVVPRESSSSPNADKAKFIDVAAWNPRYREHWKCATCRPEKKDHIFSLQWDFCYESYLTTLRDMKIRGKQADWCCS